MRLSVHERVSQSVLHTDETEGLTEVTPILRVAQPLNLGPAVG